MIRRLIRLLAAALLAGSTGCLPGMPAPDLLPRTEPVTFGGLGIGVGSAGFMAQMDLTRVKNNRVYRARWNIMGHDGYYSGTSASQVSEFSVLAGRGRICCGGSDWGSYALGGGIVTGWKGNESDDFTTIGFAGELMLVTGKIPHIAPTLLVNLNPEVPFVAVNVAILIGRMPFISTRSPRRRPFPR